jgi:hypothetical protein
MQVLKDKSFNYLTALNTHQTLTRVGSLENWKTTIKGPGTVSLEKFYIVQTLDVLSSVSGCWKQTHIVPFVRVSIAILMEDSGVDSVGPYS